MIDLQSE